MGKASESQCVACGSLAREWAYDGTDSTEIATELIVKGKPYPIKYSRFPEFYLPLCFGCHRSMDRGRWSANRTVCGNGHALTDDNVYRPPGAFRRECRRCRRDESRHRRAAERAALREMGLTARGTVPKYVLNQKGRS